MRLGHGGERDELVPRIVEVLMNKVYFALLLYFYFFVLFIICRM